MSRLVDDAPSAILTHKEIEGGDILPFVHEAGVKMNLLILAGNGVDLSGRIVQDTPKPRFIHHEGCTLPFKRFISYLTEAITTVKCIICDILDTHTSIG